MSTSYSRQDHGPRLPSRSVHATTRVRTRVKNKLRTSIQDLTVSPLFASLKRKWERQAPLLFLLLDIRDMSANVRPRPHARPQECATKNTTDRAAHADCGIERSGTKKKKNEGFGNSLGQILLLLAQALEQWRWSKARSDRKNTTHFFHFDDDDDITTSRLVGAARRVGGAALVHRLLNSFSYGMNK